MIIGIEEAPTTGTPHLQCYVQFDGRKDISTARRCFAQIGLNRIAHFEACGGSSDENFEYCSKEEFEEYGERIFIKGRPRTQRRGQAALYEALMNDIKDDKFGNIRDIATAYPMLWIKHYQAITRTYHMFSKPTQTPFFGPFRWNIQHDWNTSLHLWGNSGIGKTCFARYLLPNALFISHMDQLKSYNRDYDGIIFDDMGFEHLPRTAQIHILDIDNERALHIRYGTALIPARTKKIFLSNPPHIFICDDPAINRRLTSIHLE